MSKTYVFSRDIVTKGATPISKGTTATVSYDGKSSKAILAVEGMAKPLRVEVERLSTILEGYPKMPSLARLEKMVNNSVATTPTGYRVEPDGFGPDGSPSWLVAARVI